MTTQNTSNSIVEDVVESEGDGSPGADLRIMVKMFNELKENMQKQLNE
jgi:hypothetical protein